MCMAGACWGIRLLCGSEPEWMFGGIGKRLWDGARGGWMGVGRGAFSQERATGGVSVCCV